MANQLSRILQVNTVDNVGGAAKIAWELFTAFQSRGYDSWLAVGKKNSDNSNVIPINGEEKRILWSRFWSGIYSGLAPLATRVRGIWRLRNMARALAEPARFLDKCRGVEDFRFPGTWHLTSLTPRPPDIIHCHNLHGDYFDLRVLPWLSRQVPVIMTLHDAWLLSGHCAHSFDCERWKTGCGNCPDLSIYPAIRRDATAYNWRRKGNIFKKSRLYVATPCRWLMEKVKQSMLAPALVDFRVIANGVDLSIFHPSDNQAARTALGIPRDAKVLLFAAQGIRRNIWKDYQTMRTAIACLSERLGERRVVFIALGEDTPAERIGQAEVRFVPYQKNAKTVASYYNAADVYIHAACADTFPNTVLEALASGTPVVATNTGGIPEQINDGQTGFLVPQGDAKAMARSVEALLSNPALAARMSEQATTEARTRFDVKRMANDYLDWYAEVLRGKKM